MRTDPNHANPVSPIHDLDGNLVNDGTKVYVWDAENRLSEVRRASDNELIASYRYDSMSRRIRKTTTEFAPQGADDRVFVYEGWNLLCEYEVSNGQLALDRAYTWGPDLSRSLQGAGGVGGLLAVDEKDGSSVHSPLYDGNGNVLGLVQGTASTAASVSATYDYDAFGNTVHTSGGYADEMLFRFSTKYFDKETGLYYYGYRFYDPVTGRWPSRDPIEEMGHKIMRSSFKGMQSEKRREKPDRNVRPNVDEANFYLFVSNSPVNIYDYLGLQGEAVPAGDVEGVGESTKGMKPCGNVVTRPIEGAPAFLPRCGYCHRYVEPGDGGDPVSHGGSTNPGDNPKRATIWIPEGEDCDKFSKCVRSYFESADKQGYNAITRNCTQVSYRAVGECGGMVIEGK